LCDTSVASSLMQCDSSSVIMFNSSAVLDYLWKDAALKVLQLLQDFTFVM